MSESPLCCPAWDTWRQRDDKPAVSEMCFPVSLEISPCLEFICICIYIYINIYTCMSVYVRLHTHIYIYIWRYIYICVDT